MRIACVLLFAPLAIRAAPKPLHAPAPPAKKGKGQLVALKARSEEDATVIEVLADRPLSFTTLRLDSPPRVVLDFPDAELRAPIAAQDVNDGTVRRIGAAAAGSRTARVVIELVADTEFEVRGGGKSLDVRVQHLPRPETLASARAAPLEERGQPLNDVSKLSSAQVDARAAEAARPPLAAENPEPSAERVRAVEVAQASGQPPQSSADAAAEATRALARVQVQDARLAAEARAADERRAAEEARAAEDAKAAEALRLENARLAEEKQRAEAKAAAETSRTEESSRQAAAEAKRAAEAKLAEEQRLAGDKQAEEQRLAQEKAEALQRATAEESTRSDAEKRASLPTVALAGSSRRAPMGSDRPPQLAVVRMRPAEPAPFDNSDPNPVAEFDGITRAVDPSPRAPQARAPALSRPIAQAALPRATLVAQGAHGPANIFGIGFHPANGGTVIIRSDKAVQVLLSEDERGVRLSMPGAAIPLPNNRQPLDTSLYGGEVERLVPIVGPDGVELRIDLQSPAHARVTQDGGTLKITFARR